MTEKEVEDYYAKQDRLNPMPQRALTPQRSGSGNASSMRSSLNSNVGGGGGGGASKRAPSPSGFGTAR